MTILIFFFNKLYKKNSILQGILQIELTDVKEKAQNVHSAWVATAILDMFLHNIRGSFGKFSGVCSLFVL